MESDANMQNIYLLGLAGVLLCVHAALKIKNRRRRRYKIRPINRLRCSRGSFSYYKDMKTWDTPQFFKFTRMTISTFEKLLGKVKPRIVRQRRSDGISVEERLVITLQYLSQGMSMQILSWNFQIGHTTVHKVIQETCTVIWDVLSPEYLKSPSSTEDWLNVAHGLTNRWNFPHCIGALDGKHVNIQAPANSGSLYYNHKKIFSIVLLAACDSNYRFTMVDIGAYGSQSDGGIFRHSIFGQKLEKEDLNIPHANLLEGTNIEMPYFLVADEAFPLNNYIMRPYAGKNLTATQRIFNYRLSRARQVIENTFGILVARWRILKTTINAKPENVDNIVKAVTVLHNYCQYELGYGKEAGTNIYCPPGFVDSDDLENGLWREDHTPLQSVGRLASNHAKRIFTENRNTLAEYFMSVTGQVPWQNNIVNRGLLMEY